MTSPVYLFSDLQCFPDIRLRILVPIDVKQSCSATFAKDRCRSGATKTVARSLYASPYPVHCHTNIVRRTHSTVNVVAPMTVRIVKRVDCQRDGRAHTNRLIFREISPHDVSSDAKASASSRSAYASFNAKWTCSQTAHPPPHQRVSHAAVPTARTSLERNHLMGTPETTVAGTRD